MAIRLATDFDGGNGLLLNLDEGAGRPVVRFAAQPKNCPEAMWFHFRLNGLAGRGATVVLGNPEQTLGGGDWSGNRPVFRAAGGNWQRTGPARAVRQPDGRTEYAWDLDADGDSLEFAHCFPYQLADWRALRDELSPTFRTGEIGVTLGDHPLARAYTAPAETDKPAVYLTARHHAGETPGSWVLEGVLRRVASDAELARSVTWWAVPFVDLDDVVSGSYGKDPWPHDTNRGYGRVQRRVEAKAIMADVVRIKRASRNMLLLDLHAPSHREQDSYVPLRGWDFETPIDETAQAIAEVYHARIPEEIRSPIAHKTPKPAGEARILGMSSVRWGREMLGIDAATVETSYQGNGKVYYTIDDYRRLGSALADAAAQWVRR